MARRLSWRGWTDVVDALAEARLPIGITTNLAKTYSKNELRALGKIHTIAVSIDTSDQRLLRRLRRHVDERQIVTNINLIRAETLDRPPHFHFISGLYDLNSVYLEEFSRFAVALGIEWMNFWNLLKHYDYDASGIPADDRPMPLDELPIDRLRQCLGCIGRSFEVLRKHNIPISVHGNFVYRLAEGAGVVI